VWKLAGTFVRSRNNELEILDEQWRQWTDRTVGSEDENVHWA